ncbi:hypothetical protein, partial [Streptomyces sp. E2N166]|uniref:hypothetical protein n=1 Tax=Streptomyces sp. E2N166 TaxID=1851909 RepID=UPI001EE8ADBC
MTRTLGAHAGPERPTALSPGSATGSAPARERLHPGPANGSTSGRERLSPGPANGSALDLQPAQ